MPHCFPIGAISWLYYGDRINQLPLGIIGIAGSRTHSFHILLGYTPSVKKKRCTKRIHFHLGWFFTIPAATALIIISPLIISGVFGYGAFDEVDVRATADAREICYRSTCICCTKIISICFASNRPSVILKVSFATVFVNIILSIILMQFLGHVGLALGTSISIWFGTFYLSYLLLKEGYLILDSFNCFLPIFIFCMLMGSLLAVLESWLNKTQLLDIHVLGILVIFGICFYFSIAFLVVFYLLVY